MITKKQIAAITVVPVFILCILDLASTYLGVCVYGGTEMNVNAIRIAQTHGFLAGGVIYIILKAGIAGVMGWFLWRGREDEISRIFTIVIIVLYLTDLSTVVVLNLNTLLYQNTGKSFAPPDANQQDITPIQQEQIIQTF